MLVHFYEIRGCTCDNVDNRPVLVPPDYSNLDMLTRYQFILLEDGRWVHFLTKQEYAHVMTGYPDHDVVFAGTVQVPKDAPEDTSDGNRFAFIGMILFAASFLVGLPFVLLSDSEAENWSSIILGLASLMQMASFGLMLFTRVRYPKNVPGKILMWLFITEVILSILATIALIIACIVCVNSCVESLRSCPG